MPRLCLLSVLALFLVPVAAAAELVEHLGPLLNAPESSKQDDGTDELLVEGRRVRIAHCGDFRAPSSRRFSLDRSDLRVQGQFLALDGDTLRMRTDPDSGELAIPAACIKQVWVRGSGTSFWKGAGLGLLAGAALGALVGSQTEFCLISCSPATALGLILGAPVGFLIGSAVGSQVKSDRWRPVPLKGPHARGEPGPDGLRMGAVFFF